MPPSSKNSKKTAAPKSKQAKVELSPAPAPVTETPVDTEAPITTEPPAVNDMPYLEEFTAVVTELDNAMNTIRSLKFRLQKLEKQGSSR